MAAVWVKVYPPMATKTAPYVTKCAAASMKTMKLIVCFMPPWWSCMNMSDSRLWFKKLRDTCQVLICSLWFPTPYLKALDSGSEVERGEEDEGGDGTDGTHP